MARKSRSKGSNRGVVTLRNPFVVHLSKRPSGPQQKSYKSQRKALKASLKKGDIE